jgi:metallo-beta-lactamase family protein
VLIVGYQAEGSLGRQLVERAPLVTIFGERIAVKATIHTLNGFSAHAGQTGLLNWIGRMAGSRPRVFLTHGEDRASRPLAERLAERYGLTAERPDHGSTVTL